jgi:hypothetical protein
MNKHLIYLRLPLLLICFFCISAAAQAHTINYDLAKLSKSGVFWAYLQLGYLHILPLGLDHILFVLSLFLLSPKLSTVIWQATAFTVAHSITLGLAIYGIIEPLPAVIEPIIALSIFFVAIENILVKELKPGRIVIIFAFGLVHGMGFASALTEVGLPPSDYLVSLVSFNVGVELGQLSVILAAWLLVGKWFSDKPWYRKGIVNPASALIAFVALFWTIERTFL